MRNEFVIYKETIDAIEGAGVPYVVGGGIAVAAYGRTRTTKDIDLYVKPYDTVRALEALKRAGFEVNPMCDVKWLAKGYKNGVPVDFILENIGGIVVTDDTMKRGRYMYVSGCRMFIMSPEDLVFRKMLAMRSMRDDWYDCIAVLSNTYKMFDWEYFLWLAAGFTERALAFVLFVKTDWDHVIPVPAQVISTLMQRMG
ncbi:MAG TPA: nucleotidyltransferase [Methanocella sp.]|uniref:nucleotidyltransferase n=1 Tax=Methanocella sp. TaxID=2052833 RepID=UPI002BDF8D80|nr:nucleotidyltransferase [Methanocella sp.]HTY92161.1 nucleotidyltransferase [Methanocella sp.]